MASFINNVVKLVSGNVIAQIIGILLIPVITRIYLPEDFGTFQIFVSITSIVGMISCLSYQISIMSPKKDEDAANIMVLCFLLICITSLISAGVFTLLLEWLGSMLNAPTISQFYLFIPVVVLLNGFIGVLNYWLLRRARFGTQAASQVVNSLTSKAVQIGVGLSTPSPFGLVSGLLIGNIFGVLLMLKGIRQDFHILKQISVNRIKDLAIRYKKFPLLTTWSTLADTIANQIGPLMLAFFFNPVIVGYYALAYMVVKMPMGFIGTAIARVFFQKVSEEKNRTGKIDWIIGEVYRRLISIGIFPMLVMLIIGEELFGFIFGMEWYMAGEYAQILAPFIFFNFIASPISSIFWVLERQKIDLSFNVIKLFSRIGVLYVGGIYGNPVITLVLYSLTGVILWGGMTLYILNVAGVRYLVGVHRIIRFLLIALITLTPLIIVKYLLVINYILFCTAAICAAIYYIIIVLDDNLLKEYVVGMIEALQKRTLKYT